MQLAPHPIFKDRRAKMRSAEALYIWLCFATSGRKFLPEFLMQISKSEKTMKQFAVALHCIPRELTVSEKKRTDQRPRKTKKMNEANL
jgi:hypothetical protein